MWLTYSGNRLPTFYKDWKNTCGVGEVCFSHRILLYENIIRSLSDKGIRNDSECRFYPAGLKRKSEICHHFWRKRGSSCDQLPLVKSSGTGDQCTEPLLFTIWKTAKSQPKESRFWEFLSLLKSYHIPSSLCCNYIHDSNALNKATNSSVITTNTSICQPASQ